MVNKAVAIAMYKEGYTLRKIGEHFGVSKQRINQIIRLHDERFGDNDPRRYRIAYKVARPNPSEEWVLKKIRHLGHKAIHMPYMSPYDIIVNDKIRIEVKHSKSTGYQQKVKVGGQEYKYKVSSGMHLNPNLFDFAIIIVGQLDQEPTTYIIPSENCPLMLSIPRNPVSNTTRQRIYREAWDLLK